jgi:hypothetical protein
MGTLFRAIENLFTQVVINCQKRTIFSKVRLERFALGPETRRL